MKWFKWCKTTKEDLELQLVELEALERRTRNIINAAKKAPWYMVEDLIKYQTKIDVLRYRIKNFKD